MAVVVKPDSKYFTHLTSETSRAVHQARHLTDIASDKAADILVLGSNGTTVNTGRDSGICRFFELFQDSPRATHWFIHQLYANELLLQAVFTELDGSTTGPTGPLGRARSTLLGRSGEVHPLRVASFRAVTDPLPDCHTS